jgi:hypothetical protein
VIVTVDGVSVAGLLGKAVSWHLFNAATRGAVTVGVMREGRTVTVRVAGGVSVAVGAARSGRERSGSA